MKKLNKQEIDSEDLLKDFDNILSLIDNINSKNIDELDLETLSSKSKKIKEETEKKYNPIIKKLKDNLDSLK
tara:strand:- start:81 stop:296 length:216 start_codon:yes stop_codon:yes gene_type:complete